MTSVVMITLITGLIAGSYPALCLSGFRPVDILKGKLKAAFGEGLVRKVVVTFQFSISMLLIIAVLTVKQQVDFTQSKNLGYSRKNVITFETEGTLRLNSMNSLPTEPQNIPGVECVSNKEVILIAHMVAEEAPSGRGRIIAWSLPRCMWTST